MLVLDALAPVVGVATTSLFSIPASALMVYLGFFAGFLLYISVSDILPEAHAKASPRTSLRIMALTALGAVFTLVVSRFAE
jgi:ZIP family zinc transporter